jgi:hypothetical protein
MLPARLKTFLGELEELDVYPEYLRSLNLRWDPPVGKPINLGYINRDGEVWTDTVELSAPIDFGHGYIEDLARTLGLEVEKTKMEGHWHVRKDGKAPKIEWLMTRPDDWTACIGRFVDKLREHYAKSEG